ncbi:MAG: RidA family protein [Proteobacteria bacterium]|nr:MAG: RidA family protein [Pseudomonadota bacterium]
MRFLQPPGWAAPRGYSNGVATRGEMIFVAGQVGWNGDEVFEHAGFVEQAEQALRNIVAVLSEAGAEPRHLVRLTWFIADVQEYAESLAPLGDAYRRVVGSHFPAMSVIEVNGFIEDGARLEIEATAVVPDR